MILKGKISNSVKKQSKRRMKLGSKMEDKVCPLCLEVYDMDDITFFPCKCLYQICRFCWHRIRTNENGLCPACRRAYTEDPANFKPISQEDIQRLKTEKKMKEMQKKKELAENRKQLANVRVVQKNLVFVHGLPVGIDTQEEKYRRLLQIFKDCGPVTKCVVNNKTNYAGSQVPRASVYVTFQRIEDALKAYKSLPSKIEDYDVKTSLGTTKYCSTFLKSVHCSKQDCMYLHEYAEEELCFTKEQIHSGEHLQFGDILYEKMMSHTHSKLSQCNQPKDPVITEQEVETQPKINPVQAKDCSSSCSSDESSNSPRQNNTSLQQSRLQSLFSNRDSQNHTLESEEMEMPLGCHLSYDELISKFVISTNGDSSVQKSLSEESTVNNTHRTVKKSDIFIHPESQDIPQNDLWPEHRNSTIGQSNSVHNHQNTNKIPNDFDIVNKVNSASHILNNLSLNHSESGSSSTVHPKTESPEYHDDDLGFDPIEISMHALQDMIKSQQVNQRDINVPQPNWLQQQQQQQQLQQPPQQLRLNSVQQPSIQAMRMKLQQLQQRQKNPPPGFAVNSLQSSQPLPSPAYDSRNNVLINRMSPVLNVSNSYTPPPPVRTNFQIPRYQQGGVSLNGSAVMNGFSSQPVRNLAPQPLTLQAQAMQEYLSRSVPTTQHIQSQNQSISHPQYGHIDPNLSPSYWNVNQSQWMHAENSFPNQSMQDFRPGSPALHRRIQPQMRPADFSRQIQQAASRYNNPSPFPDTPQYIYQTAQHNQATKGVHNFP